MTLRPVVESVQGTWTKTTTTTTTTSSSGTRNGFYGGREASETNKQTNKKSRGACNVMDNSSRTALTDSVILSSVLRTSGRNDVNMLYFSKMTNMAFVYKYT